MLKDVEFLIKIQEQDLEIMKCQAKLKENPELVFIAKQGLEKAEAELKDNKDELKQIQVGRKTREISVESCNTQINKLDSQAGTLRDNKSYKALQHEILDLKAKIALIEDEILVDMEKSEKISEEIKKQKDTISVKIDNVKESERTAEKENEDMKKEIAGLKKMKAELIENVSPVILARYERLLKNKKDAVVVPSRHKSCGGCNMKLTPQVIMKLKGSMEVVSCENCQRIVYWDS